MTPSEAAVLLGLIAIRDGRTISEAAARALAEDLHDIRLADAKLAVSNHFQRSADWLMPMHIRHEVRRIRDARLEGIDSIQPPADLSPWGGYLPWFRTTRAAIADGEPAPQPPQLHPRDMRAIDGVFPAMPGPAEGEDAA